MGARTLQEGGAFDPWSREQVELFCVDRLIMVEVTCSEEKITVDFGFPTPPPRSGGCSGVEAALQLVHKILYPGAFCGSPTRSEGADRPRAADGDVVEVDGRCGPGEVARRFVG